MNLPFLNRLRRKSTEFLGQQNDGFGFRSPHISELALREAGFQSPQLSQIDLTYEAPDLNDDEMQRQYEALQNIAPLPPIHHPRSTDSRSRPVSRAASVNARSISPASYAYHSSRSGSALSLADASNHASLEGQQLLKYLLIQVNDLKREVSDLKTQLGRHDSLDDKAPSSSSSNHLPREKFPSVKFWTRQEWKDSGLKGSAYLEDEDGEPLPLDEANKIRKRAKRIWQEFLDVGIAPQTWTRINASADQQYRAQMENDFPILRLCDGHWKVERIATDNYPSWRSHAQSKGNVSENSIDSKGVGYKRLSQLPSGSAAKRRKPEQPTSSTDSLAGQDAAPNGHSVSGLAGLTIPNATMPIPTRGETSAPAPLPAHGEPPGVEPPRPRSFSFTITDPLANINLPRPASYLAEKAAENLGGGTSAFQEHPLVGNTSSTVLTSIGGGTPFPEHPLTDTTASPISTPFTFSHTPSQPEQSQLPVNHENQLSAIPAMASQIMTISDGTIVLQDATIVTPPLSNADEEPLAALPATMSIPTLPSRRANEAPSSMPPVTPALALPDIPSTSISQNADTVLSDAPDSTTMQPEHKDTILRPTASTTPRNLCAQDWKKKNRKGTTNEFRLYWANLPMEQKQIWEAKSKAMKNEGHIHT